MSYIPNHQLTRKSIHLLAARRKRGYGRNWNPPSECVENPLLGSFHAVRANAQGRPIANAAVALRRERKDFQVRISFKQGVTNIGSIIGLVESDDQTVRM